MFSMIRLWILDTFYIFIEKLYQLNFLFHLYFIFTSKEAYFLIYYYLLFFCLVCLIG